MTRDEILTAYPSLSGTSLYWANLSRANLSRANLSRANLSGANLYEAGPRSSSISQTTRPNPMSFAPLTPKTGPHCCASVVREYIELSGGARPQQWLPKHEHSIIRLYCSACKSSIRFTHSKGWERNGNA